MPLKLEPVLTFAIFFPYLLMSQIASLDMLEEGPVPRAETFGFRAYAF